jgi:hypothetical protein
LLDSRAVFKRLVLPRKVPVQTRLETRVSRCPHPLEPGAFGRLTPNGSGSQSGFSRSPQFSSSRTSARKDSAEGTLSVSDALRVFSIRSLVAAKANEDNERILSDIVRGRHSKFLSTDFIF